MKLLSYFLILLDKKWNIAAFINFFFTNDKLPRVLTGINQGINTKILIKLTTDWHIKRNLIKFNLVFASGRDLINTLLHTTTEGEESRQEFNMYAYGHAV